MEGKKTTLLDRLKDATNTVATKTREGIEDLQTRHELNQAYGDLGRAVADLVEGGELTHPSLTASVARIKELKAQLEAQPEPAAEPTPEG